MTRNDIIRMAREAGLSITHPRSGQYNGGSLGGDAVSLQRFAALVAAAEREACAKTCEALEVHDAGHPGTALKIQGMCIDAIRASQTA